MSWQNQLENSVKSFDELESHIAIPANQKDDIKKIMEKHPVCIPEYYLSLIDPNDPDDPIRRMAVPSIDELDATGSFDTSGEKESTRMPGLQHKYAQTALVLSTNRCAMYCRHCFRKRLVGLPNTELIQRFDEAAEYIKKHKEITNVLITGGDPFVLPTNVISRFLDALTRIDHLSFIRFGSRVPVTLPARIYEDEEFLDTLARHSRIDRRIYVVTQFNHPKELTDKAIQAIAALIKAGVLLNNQTVLLKGVNDNPETLAELQQKLIETGVYPYYVFQCRPVSRVMHHFQVPLYQGYSIVEDAKKYLNGHSKRFKYVMSHDTGKIEIVGVRDDEIFFKYHQARNPDDLGKFFSKKLDPNAGWLDSI